MLATPPPKEFITTKSPLEQQLIHDFLAEKGYSLEDLKALPEEEAHMAMTEAFTYASKKMIEIQMRIQYLQSLSFEEW